MKTFFLLVSLLVLNTVSSQDYFSDRLFVKLKDEYKIDYSLEKDNRLPKLLIANELVSITPVSKHLILSSTYEVVFKNEIDIDSLIDQLNLWQEIDFVEKVPMYKLFFTPNDPLYSTQWNLSKIQADLAWNLSQGCSNVKIAVTDDAFLMNHQDLVNQWHINTGEIAGNGIDDDGNGYIDDWRGWDAANNDNDPSATAPTNSFFTHGTHVAGIVAAQTNNSTGIASIGYNCKMIPVKIGSSPSSSLTGAFQGLDYAVNASGCDVINMSWGGGGWSATYQALFNIAKTKGIICVAAAGNSNTSTPMYPASYNHVISVAASASTDARASFSNFGSTIDVTAPGVDIPSCLAGATNAYGNSSGTSMASPLVAGLCGLMKCYNPMPSDSIEACLNRTCDNINAQNPSFIGQLGAGRINAYQALQCLTKKPKSDFIVLDTFQCTGKSVRYAAKSFGIPTLTYNWSFPGGSPSTSTSANPVVIYATNGLKSANLITCNSLGCDTITKTNVVNIDTPKAWLMNRKYTSYNSNPVLITIKFSGNPPYSVTLTDATNAWTQSNVKANPYFFSIIPTKDTSLISISSFSDSSCVGNRYGMDTIYRVTLGGGGSSDCDTTNLNTGKVLHLDFNGNTQDKSGNGNHATNFGATAVAGKSGVANTAYRFDSTNYMSVAHHASLNLRSFTLTAILKPLKFNTNLCYGNNIISKGANGALGQWALAYGPADAGNTCIGRDTNLNNFLLCGSTCQASWYIPDTPYMKYDKWNCIVTTYDSSSKVAKMYVDGKLRHQWTTTWDLLTNSNTLEVLIGKFAGINYPFYIQAVIDDIRIYNRVLAPSEVKGYCGTCSITPNPPLQDCDTTNLNTGKVLHLDFNGNTQDKSGNGNHATNNGATLTSDRKGNADAAYSFNGSTSRMVIPNFPTPSSNNISISLWFKSGVSTQQAYAGLLDHSHTTGTLKNWTIQHSNMNSAIFFEWRNSLTNWANTINDPVSYDHTKWNHLVVVKKTDTLQYYLNCILVFEKKYNGMVNIHKFAADLNIGFVQSNSGPIRYYNGSIDELRIYDRVLTQSEIKALGDCCLPAIPSSDCDTTNLNTGKVLHLDFNGNTQDKSGNGNHATNNGAIPVAGKSGIANTAYRFDGVNDFMQIANSASLSPTKITMCAILKPKDFYTGPCMNNQIMAKNNIYNSGHYSMVYAPLNNGGACSMQDINQCNFYSGLSSSGCGVAEIYKPPFIKKDTWYCVITTYDGDSAKNYVNGELRYSCKINIPLGSNSADLFIGRLNSASYPYWLNADVDDIRIYNRVLAPSEVKGYCGTCNITPNPPTVICDTFQRFTYTQCLNDSIQAVLRPGSQYQWSPITGLSNDTIHNPKIKVSSNRIYLISYLSAKGCQLVDTVEIKVQSPALYSPIPDQLICVGDSVQMTIPIYATNIIWSPNLTISSTTSRNPFFFPTTNQTYFLAFRDTFGCIQRDTFVFNTKICCSARARFTLSDSVLCFGTRPTITNTSKGTINFYNWNFGSTMPSSANTAAPPFLTYPTGGNYVIRLIVGNALCQDTMIKTLYLVRFKPQAGRDTANCQASYTVQLGEGSISTWSYLWKPSAYLDDPRVSNPICTILNDSVRYIVEAEDKMSGCKFTDTVTVKTNLRLDSTVSKSRICDKDSLLFNGIYYKQSGRYFYTLKTKDLKCDSLLFIKYLNVQGKDSIVYSPEVYCEFHIDKNGLRRTSSYMSIDTFKSSLGCDSFYHKKQILIFKVTYKDKDIKACNEVIFRGKKYFASKYNIDSTKIKGPYSGCDSIITRYHVIVLPKPNVSIDASRPNPLRIKDTVTLTAKGGTSYLWLQNLSTNPILNYKSNKVEEVVYTVRVTDTNNCWDTVSYKIVTEFDKECHYGIPNVFTPNNDDLNDIFIPNLSDCADIQLFAVYNRWGEKMFETNENKGWDGYYKNKLAPAGAYVYLLELKTTIGIRLHRGTFVLVR